MDVTKTYDLTGLTLKEFNTIFSALEDKQTHSDIAKQLVKDMSNV